MFVVFAIHLCHRTGLTPAPKSWLRQPLKCPMSTERLVPITAFPSICTLR